MVKYQILLLFFMSLFGFSSIAQFNQPGQNSVLQNTMNTPNGGYSESLTPLDAPPHKGVVKEAGKFYIEVVVNWMLSSNNAVFYLLKSDGKPIDREKVICKAVIQREGKEDEPLVVKQYGLNAFSTHLISGEEFHLKVTFKKKKKEYTAIFQTKGDGEKYEETPIQKNNGGHQHSH